jgi:hypothetical protein
MVRMWRDQETEGEKILRREVNRLKDRQVYYLSNIEQK